MISSLLAMVDIGATVFSEPVCKRCNRETACQRIRSEHVCGTCFMTYVTTKTIKRMETYRLKGSSCQAPRKLLFPLSYGPCSASLLHILDAHLQGQYDRMNRTAYELFVVHIDLYVQNLERDVSAARLKQFEARFPRHTYIRLGLEDALNLDNVDWKALDIPRPGNAGRGKLPSEQLQDFIGSIPSATSRADIASTMLTRLLVDVGNRNGCESILFGDSTTKLAEKTLAETAKGRGFSLPWQISDGTSPFGIGFNYPLRDLLKKEVVAFSSLAIPPLSDLIIHDKSNSNFSASSKSTTINDLMAQYFESIEENYPSIVANVVRTCSKLNPITNTQAGACGLCGLPVNEGTDSIFDWGGYQNSTSRLAYEAHSRIFCYGCSRSVNG